MQKNIYKKLMTYFFISLSFMLVSLVKAQTVEIKTKAAIEFLVSGSQKLTKREYEKFWEMMPTLSPSEKEKFNTSLKPLLVDGLEYQRNLWLCAREAWQSQRTPECKDAFRVFDRMMRLSKSKGIETSPMLDSLENSKRLLSAASQRGVLKGYDGREILLSLELINRTISQLDIKFSRVQEGLR